MNRSKDMRMNLTFVFSHINLPTLSFKISFSGHEMPVVLNCTIPKFHLCEHKSICVVIPNLVISVKCVFG